MKTYVCDDNYETDVRKKAKSVGRGRVSGNTNRPMDRKTDKMKKIKATFNKFESTIVTATNREYR